jgi:hypothetical protein
MAILPKSEGAKFYQVRSIFGQGRDRQEAMKRYNHIPEGGMNKVIEDWHAKQADRELVAASPSQIATCPRTVWLTLHDVPRIDEMTWALKQRLLLGRLFENQFAEELADADLLLHHWKDDPGMEVEKFSYGKKGDATYFEGVPDYLTKIDGTVYISDAKTSRSDAFGYVPINDFEIWTDGGWYKNRMQLIGYYILCHANKAKMEAMGFPLHQGCQLFSYALDDGVVRREVKWVPTQDDINKFLEYTIRFNKAMNATECPACTCGESLGGFEIKFCKYGVKADGAKIAESCCDDNLITLAKV